MIPPRISRIFRAFFSSMGTYTLYPHFGHTPFSISAPHFRQCMVSGLPEGFLFPFGILFSLPFSFFRFYCNTILPPPQQNKAARRFFSRKNLIRPLYTVSKNLNFRPYFAIIEAKIQECEAFIGIFAPYSNIACLCYNRSKNMQARSICRYFRALLNRAKRCYNKSEKKPRYNKIEEKPYAIYPYRQQQHRTACGLL